jgi:hypothetical protein
MRQIVSIIVICIFVSGSLASAQDSIWDLQAVDSLGQGTHSKVGATPIEANKVTIEGIALNNPGEILNTNMMWQVYVQAEDPDRGGIAAWAGIFYNSNWPRYPEDIEPGDRIRISGYVVDHRGKVNINERHSAAPELQFTVTVLEEDAGMPAPIVIPSVSDCNYFDESRMGGGEYYQSQWVRLNDIQIVSGTWAAGETLVVSDVTGATVSMLLSSEGDFDDYSAPAGVFDATGIFDQEDESSPYTEAYRLWVKNAGHISGVQSSVENWNFY